MYRPLTCAPPTIVRSQLTEIGTQNADNIDELIQRAARGDQPALSELLSMYRDRLTKMVRLRLDPRLFGRVDASDIVQEATIEAARRLREYAETLPMDFSSWLRQLAGQKMIDADRIRTCNLWLRRPPVSACMPEQGIDSNYCGNNTYNFPPEPADLATISTDYTVYHGLSPLL